MFCREETEINFTQGESSTCPKCGVYVLALPQLPHVDQFWQLAKEVEPDWDAVITVRDNRFLVFLWDPQELLPTSQVADILAHSDARAVSNLIRSGHLPNAARQHKGKKSIRYFVPRKDIVDHMNRKTKAQKEPL
jgi:hypothetical protein